MGRVVSADECLRFRRKAGSEGKRVVFTNGCFDILHRGHLEYLRQAKAMGDLLIVGVNGDRGVRLLKGPGRPITQEEDRAELVAALTPVDRVVVFQEETPARLIDLLVPDVLVKGGDYRLEEIVGRDTVEKAGGTVRVVPLLPGRSTRGIVEVLRKHTGAEGD